MYLLLVYSDRIYIQRLMFSIRIIDLLALIGKMEFEENKLLFYQCYRNV